MTEKQESDYSPKVIFGKNRNPDGTFNHYVTGYNLDLNFRWGIWND